MKMKLKFMLIICFFLLLIIVNGIYLNRCIKCEYKYDMFYVGISENYTTTYLEDTYSMNTMDVEKILASPEEYTEIQLSYSITNDSFVAIKSFSPRLISGENIWLNNEKPEYSRPCYLAAGDTRQYFARLIVKSSELDNVFDDLRFNIRGWCQSGIFFSSVSRYKGAYDITSISSEDLWSHLKSSSKAIGLFSPFNNLSNFNINDCNDLFTTFSTNRYTESNFYSVIKFDDNGTTKYGLAYFSKKGQIICGMLCSSLLSYQNYKKYDFKSFEDVLSFDKGATLFNSGDYFISYHYFDDNRYVAIKYKKEGNIYKVFDVQESKYPLEYTSILLSCDLDLLR